MKKASTDNKNYKLKKVAEEIKLLQVIDTDTPWFAIAFLIHNGSFNDPEDCPGLAHLFEHCLFTGSENFPQDNQLTHFLDKHHGQVNAWTSTEQTVFYLKVHQSAAIQALTMLLDMLINPLFTLEGIGKELATIDSEFHNKYSEEQRRIQDVQKETCNQVHPFSRFSVGNKAAFENHSVEQLQQKLQQWHRDWVTSDNIHLCSYSTNETAEFEQLLSMAFSQLDANNSPRETRVLPPLYTENELQKIIFIESKKQHLRILLTFRLAHGKLNFHEKYDALISHLIGYEGDGSLLQFLKTQKWATQLITGIGLTGSNFTDFNINLEMTETGMENMESVIQSVFLFTRLLANSDLEKFYKEKARLNQLAFEYHTPESPLDCVLRLVRNMDAYPDEEILSGEYLMDKMDAQKIRSLLFDIAIPNMRVLVIAPEVPCNRISQWYQVPYSIHSTAFNHAPEALQNQFEQCVSLPNPNGYIPTPDRDSEQISELPQQRVINQNSFWCGRDTTNSEAQGECFFSWRANDIKPDIRHVASKKLFSSTLEARLNDRFYPAQVAGLHYRVYAHQNGVGLHTSGFADKQLMLCNEIVRETLASPALCDNFELHKQEYLNSLQSSIAHKPLNRLFTVLQAVFVQASWLPEDLAKHVQIAQFGDVVATQNKIFANYKCEALLYGDFTHDAMNQFIDGFPIDNIHTTSNTSPQLTLLSEISQRSLKFACEHQDAAYVFYLQSRHKSLHEQAKMMLVESLLAGFYFNWMRNEKQLGYQVGTGYMPFNEHPGTALYVQSTTSSPVEIDRESRQCLQAFCQWFSQISESQWERCRHNIIRQLDETNVSFSVTCQRLWGAIGRADESFSTEQQLQQIILTLTLNEVLAWFTELAFDFNNHFTIYSPGAMACDDAHFEQPLNNIYQFKN